MNTDAQEVRKVSWFHLDLFRAIIIERFAAQSNAIIPLRVHWFPFLFANFLPSRIIRTAYPNMRKAIKQAQPSSHCTAPL